MKKRHTYLWAMIYGVLLAAFTVYILLDAFVIPHDIVYISDTVESTDTSGSDTVGEDDKTDNTDVTEENDDDTSVTDEETTDGGSGEIIITDTSYICDEFSIVITTYRENDTDIYVADIVLGSPSYLSAGLAGGAFGRNLTAKTSEIAEQVGAILAINGDYYGYRDTGYVMRNGYLYRTTASDDEDAEDLVIYEDGTWEIVYEADVTAEELAAAGAYQIFSFGPSLVRDGTISVSKNTEVEQARSSNPRTAVGYISDCHYVFVVSDGRTDESEGLTLYELAGFMQSLGCTLAYNLDGGGSSTMWFMGTVVNNPTSSGNSIKERSVSDIVYIG
ncbi:MAG: phosphodiester glycosidase family protein [Clostridia bacterium]|nr:phosphodiester glycosidase family protein [Clostridia bacterium]